MKMAKTLKSLVRMMLTWGLYEIVHNLFLEWPEMSSKAILLQYGLQMVTPIQFGSEGHCLIRILALRIQIAFSFSTSVQHQGIRMCKTTTLDGIAKEVYVGRWMKLNLPVGNIQML